MEAGKEKSKKREETEQVWKKEGGFPRKGSHSTYVFCFGGERPKLDGSGQLQIVGNPNLGTGFQRRRLK